MTEEQQVMIIDGESVQIDGLQVTLMPDHGYSGLNDRDILLKITVRFRGQTFNTEQVIRANNDFKPQIDYLFEEASRITKEAVLTMIDDQSVLVEAKRLLESRGESLLSPWNHIDWILLESPAPLLYKVAIARYKLENPMPQVSDGPQ